MIPGGRKKAHTDMSVFSVISLVPNAALAAKIAAIYPNENIPVSPTVWFVSDSNVTAAQVCEKLGVRTAQSEVGLTDIIVVRFQGYFGHATSSIWQWLALKGATP